MKKILLSAVALMAFGAMQAQSEEMKFGVKAGATNTTLVGDLDALDAKIGFYAGGLVDLPVSGNFHIQPELLFSMEGAEDAGLTYLRVPIMAKYYIFEGFNIQAGPQLGIKVAAEDDFTDELTKSVDFGLAAGVAYELPMGLFFDIRYNVGLANISDVDGGDITTAGVMLGAGWRF
ncbi:MAG: PorT family protein [Pedobacter sp.]|nr:MAG: PorT family protein [Pedobacter sp.]